MFATYLDTKRVIMDKNTITPSNLLAIGFQLNNSYTDENIDFEFYSFREIEVDFANGQFECIELVIDKRDFKLEGITTIEDIQKLKIFIYGTINQN